MENKEILDDFVASRLPQFEPSLILKKLKEGGINNAYEVEGDKIVIKDYKYITLTINKDKAGVAKISHNIEFLNPYSFGVGIGLAVIFMIFNVLGNIVAAVIGLTVGTIAYSGKAKILNGEIHKILTSE
jgi:hypothetical protein